MVKSHFLHQTGTLYPADGETRKYGQLYIIEGGEATTICMNAPQNRACRVDIMETIQNSMIQNSPYAAAFKHMDILY